MACNEDKTSSGSGQDGDKVSQDAPDHLPVPKTETASLDNQAVREVPQNDRTNNAGVVVILQEATEQTRSTPDPAGSSPRRRRRPLFQVLLHVVIWLVMTG